MRAVIVDPSSGTLAIEHRPDPSPGPGELLVRVRAAGLNRADLLARTGAYRRGDQAGPPRPFVGGGEVAGEVVAVGDDVRGWRVDQRVMAMGAGWCELAVIDAGVALPVPDDYSWEEAGASPVTMLTAHDALRTNGRWQAGQSVLVHAVTSGMGVATVRLAAHLGAAPILGTTRTPPKLERLLPLGLDVGVHLGVDALADVARASTDGRGVDVVVDNIGASVLADTIDATAVRGRIVQVGRLGGRRAELDLDELARKRISLIGVTFRTRSAAERRAVVRAFLDDVGDALAAGHLRPLVDAVYRFDDIEAAQEAMARGEHVGKLVLVP